MEEDQCKAKKTVKSEKSQRKPDKSKPVSESNTRPILEFPHFLRIIGPKHVNIMMQFVPSLITYSITSLILISYMSEWKEVLQYLPYYNGKYAVEESEKKDIKKEEEN